jgi:hypothetical protein
VAIGYFLLYGRSMGRSRPGAGVDSAVQDQVGAGLSRKRAGEAHRAALG